MELTDKSRKLLAALIWIVFCFSASLTAIFVSVNGWYAELLKPSWNPPAFVFGPVWTLLYIMMGISAWIIWLEGGFKKQWKPLSLFLGQWILNAMWTPLFFGLHRPDWALLDLSLMWMLLLFTLISFWNVQKKAAFLLIPYFVWASFAGVLNFTIWRMNPITVISAQLTFHS